jgi:hypothetical protein
MKWVGHTARMGKIRNAYKIKIGKSVRKRIDEDGRLMLT